MTPAKSPPSLFTLILLTASSILSLNMFLPSLANIASDLDTNYGLVSLAVAGYLAITAVLQLIIGPMSDRFGRRPVMLVSLVVFCLAALVCAFAQNVWVFLIFRMLQGGMTAGHTLSLAIVRDTNTPKKAVSLISYISMVMAIAPMLGPVLGGVLDAAFGWRANFGFYSILGIGLLMLCWFDLGETRPQADKPAQPAASGQNPAGMLNLVREPLFWGYALCAAFSTSAFYVFLAGAPLVASATFGISTAELGFFIGSITGGFMTGSFISTRLAPHFALPTIMLTGRIIAVSGISLGLVAVTMGWLSPALFFGSTIFVGIGNGITMPSTNTGAMSIRPDLAGSAAGLIGSLTLATGALLTTLTGMLITPDNGPHTLLSMMLSSAGIALLAAMLVWYLERQRPDPESTL